MTDHAANLARVQALRDHLMYVVAVTPKIPTERQIKAPLLDHIEDVLTRHAPVDVGTVVPEVYCEDDREFPCPDYTSALTLLDALDGGAS